MSVCLSFFFSLLLLFVVVISPLKLPTNEINALKDLYVNTQGIHWKWILPYNAVNGYPWNFTNPVFANPCNESYPWQGIQCIVGTSNYHVSAVQLPSYLLTGKK